MINATNVSQKESETALIMSGETSGGAKKQEQLSNGEIMLSNGKIGRPMSEEMAIAGRFRISNRNAFGRFVEAVRNVNAGKYSQDDIAFILHEGHLHLRTAYGVYMSMCMEKDIRKKITWRTFYMQCSGYRTLKPHTMEAVARFVVMMVDGVFAGSRKEE